MQGKQTTVSQNSTIKFGNKSAITNPQIVNGFVKQYTSAAPVQTTMLKRQTQRILKNMQTEAIQIEPEEVKLAIKSAPTKKSTGADGISTFHLKHLGETVINLLSKLYTLAINKNTIPQTWKLSKIIPLLKPGKERGEG